MALVIYSDPRFVSVAASLHGAVLGTSIISASKLSAEHVQTIEQDFQFKERLNPNADCDSEAKEKKGQEDETEEAENRNDEMEEGKTQQEQVLIYMHSPLSYVFIHFWSIFVRRPLKTCPALALAMYGLEC